MTAVLILSGLTLALFLAVFIAWGPVALSGVQAGTTRAVHPHVTQGGRVVRERGDARTLVVGAQGRGRVKNAETQALDYLDDLERQLDNEHEAAAFWQSKATQLENAVRAAHQEVCVGMYEEAKRTLLDALGSVSSDNESDA